MFSFASFRSLRPPLIVCGALLGLVAFSASHVVAFGATHELAATQSRVRLVVDNPTPGALLPPVPVQLNGSATDPGAQSGTSGVDRVQVFVNDPNSTDKLLVSDAQVAPDGTWTATANLAGRWGSGNLYVVAHSSVDGGETTVNIPVMFLW